MRVLKFLPGCGDSSGPPFQRPAPPGSRTLFLPSLLPAPGNQQLPEHEKAFETLLHQEKAPTFSELHLFEIWSLTSIPFIPPPRRCPAASRGNFFVVAAWRMPEVYAAKTQLSDTVQLRPGTASRRNAMHNRTSFARPAAMSSPIIFSGWLSTPLLFAAAETADAP